MSEEIESKTVVLTSENREAFMAEKLGLDKVEEPKEVIQEEPKAEEEELEDDDSQKEEEPTKEEPEKKVNPKQKSINERFHKLTQQREAEKARADELEARLREMEQKIKPIESTVDENGRPDATKYTDTIKYAEDLAEWSASEALRKDRIRQQQEQAQKQWMDRVEKARADLPDFDEVLSSSELNVRNHLLSAISESDIGPKLAYHLAENPELVDSLNNMSFSKSLIELGKLEIKLSDKPKEEKALEVSKAPKPISPIKASSTETGSSVNSNGEFTGSFQEYRNQRKAGKIK